MKFILITLSIIGLLFCSGCNNKNNEVITNTSVLCSASESSLTFNHNGQDRKYLLYLTENLPANSPLVFVLHGSGENNEFSESLDFQNIADTAEFALCFPQGLDCTWDKNSLATNDVSYLKALALFLQTEYNLNPAKTFVAGYSSGGAMSYLLVLDANDVFKAAAIVSGNINNNVWQLRNPLTAIPIFHIHGVDDVIIPINGGGADNSPATDTIVDYWAGINNCTLLETVNLSPNTTAYYHTGGTNGNEVWYYKINNYGHGWPGLTPDVTGIIASEEIWRFFRKF
jgi:polyhydroxybutyrate depolymerase